MYATGKMVRCTSKRLFPLEFVPVIVPVTDDGVDPGDDKGSGEYTWPRMQ